MEKVGMTTDGRPVVNGVFEFYDTHGFPLADMLDYLQAKGIVPCWPSFIKSAKNAGWPYGRIYSYIREAVKETHGVDHWDKMKGNLALVLDC